MHAAHGLVLCQVPHGLGEGTRFHHELEPLQASSHAGNGPLPELFTAREYNKVFGGSDLTRRCRSHGACVCVQALRMPTCHCIRRQVRHTLMNGKPGTWLQDVAATELWLLNANFTSHSTPERC